MVMAINVDYEIKYLEKFKWMEYKEFIYLGNHPGTVLQPMNIYFLPMQKVIE